MSDLPLNKEKKTGMALRNPVYLAQVCIGNDWVVLNIGV